jgi:hypothetical protein
MKTPPTRSVRDKCALLLELNPWTLGDAGGRAASETLELLNRRHSAESKQFAQARSAATRARLAGGTKAWNDWAAAMLGLKAEVEHLPSALEFWRNLVRVDLAGEIFSKKNSDFGGLLFPGPVDFSHASFPVDAWFSAAHFNDTADFSETTFDQDGFFEQAEFCKTARFDRARWSGDAQFRKSKFHRDATFRDARFDSHAWFIGSSFGGALSFAASQFAGEAGLGQCDYHGPSDFSLVRFRDHAGFGEAHFFSAVRFDRARFEHLAWFQNARFESHVSFDRAQFVGMVNFKSIILPEEPDVRDRVANLEKRLANRGA